MSTTQPADAQSEPTQADRILVTGASGFIGKRLVSTYLAAGRLLTLAVRDRSRCEPAWLVNPNVRVVETGPLERAGALGEALRDVAAVVHLAGLAHVTRSHGGRTALDAFMAANDAATARLVDAALAAGTIKAFVYLSSIAAIAENSADHLVGDDSTRMPVSPYGLSKRAAERHLERLAAEGIFAVALRPPLIFGPAARGNWGQLLRLSWSGVPLPFGAAHNRRSMISIETMVEAIAHLTSNHWPDAKSGSYCVADAGTISLARIVAELRRGMDVPRRMFAFPDPVLHGLARLAMRKRRVAGLLGDLEVDGSRFNAAFGFRPTQTLSRSVYLCGAAFRDMAGARK